MRSATVTGSAPRLAVDNEAQAVTLFGARQTVTIVSPERYSAAVDGMLDFSTPDNSGLLALLEDF